ncbi:MAG TPA: cob(I)yrinic acid a,c-diamide adenosyltransferase [Thiolinea sp.]|nr:cob(I)yrinic acid a,c-diamide adenosyltransferase [Thiolinea sp.]
MNPDNPPVTDTTETDAETRKNQRHQERMARRKAVIDAGIAQASQDKGLVVILTGNGKGKSSSAFGMVGRSLGHGLRVGVCQFIKSRTDTGEEAFFSRQPGVEWHVLGDGFTWDTQDRQQDIATSKRGWTVAQRMLADPGMDVVVLDELTYLLNYGYLDTAAVLADIRARPPAQHVIITGRAASPALCELADTIAEIGDVKHAYRAGIQAQQGIDL